MKPNKDITNKLHETVASLQKVKTERAEAKSLPKSETPKNAQSSKPQPPKSESKLSEQKIKHKAAPNDPDSTTYHTDEQREKL